MLVGVEGWKVVKKDAKPKGIVGISRVQGCLSPALLVSPELGTVDFRQAACEAKKRRRGIRETEKRGLGRMIKAGRKVDMRKQPYCVALEAGEGMGLIRLWCEW